ILQVENHRVGAHLCSLVEVTGLGRGRKQHAARYGSHPHVHSVLDSSGGPTALSVVACPLLPRYEVAKVASSRIFCSNTCVRRTRSEVAMELYQLRYCQAVAESGT